MHKRKNEFVSLLSKKYRSVEAVQKLLKDLFESTLKEMPEAEIVSIVYPL